MLPLQGQYTRRTPLGFDRHWNRYWLLGSTDDGGSPKLYVERTTPVWHGEVCQHLVASRFGLEKG